MKNIGVLVESGVAVLLGGLSIAEGIRMVKTKGIQLYDVLGPGWYNIGIGAVLVLGGIAYFVVRHGEMGATKDSTAGGGPLKVVMLVSVMAIYLFLIDLVSYLLASLVFFFLVTRVSGFVSWRTNVALALAFGIFFYVVFAVWMGMIFPRGLFW